MTDPVVGELRIDEAEAEIRSVEIRSVEESLEISRRKFLALYDLAPVGYLTLDEHGGILQANRTTSEMLGVDRLRLPGRSLETLLVEGQSRGFRDHLAEVVEGKVAVSCELVFRRTCGEPLHARVTSSPAPPTLTGGNEVFLTLVDISDRVAVEDALRDREQRLRAIVDHAPLAIALVDADGNVIECNEVLERFVEARSEDVCGRPIADHVFPADRGALASMLSSGGRAVEPLVRLGPRALDMRAWTTPVEDGPIRDARRLLLMEDIRAETAAVERAEILERELRSLHQEKLQALGQLAGGVAHDFNNMLAAIMAFAECALLTDDLPDQIREDLSGIRDASLRARDLVREVLTFARRRKPIRAPVELHRLLRSSIALVRGAAPSHVRFEYPERIRASVFADEGQIEQAVVNVLTNAVQAFGSDPGRVEVTVREVELVDAVQSDGTTIDAGLFWQISIRDDGPGISADLLERIFEPFFTTRERAGGCGMGLATCQSVVELHGGLLEVESEPGGGAEFRILLPALVAKEEAPARMPSTPERFEGEVLLVDDEPLVLRASERLLLGLGAHVTTRCSPREALELVRSAPTRFDVLLTDVTMPEMSGTRLARAVARVAPELPVLLLTGNRGRIDPESLAGLRVAGVIEKPLSLREMSEALGRLAARARRADLALAERGED